MILSPRAARALRLGYTLAVVLAVSGCAGGYEVGRRPDARAAAPVTPTPISWFAPRLPGDLDDLERWRRSVGPPVVLAGTASSQPSDRLVVANWNVHVGGGDIPRLVADLRRQHGAGTPLVLLIQEAYRAGPEVPAEARADASFASLIRGLRRDGGREEIEGVARALGLHAYYVPSMRNGAPLSSDEDRGNAILSTLPLSRLSAIELPFERQRRVAIAATVEGLDAEGRPWALRVVSAHLDNMAGARRLWAVGGELGRTRQARGLVSALATDPAVVLGADMNTLFGFRDAAYTETVRAFPDTYVSDPRATFFGMLRLDHLFFRLDDGWRASFRRADDNYGSDHMPLIGVVEVR